MMKLLIDQQQLQNELEALAGYSSEAPPVVTRVVFSPSDRAARTYLKQLFAEAGLEVREDAVGNTFARWVGSDPTLPAIGTGSHIDAIPNAGKYDGTVGVLGGLEAIRSLHRSGYLPRHSIELLLFTAEEPTRFGIGCLGSRMLCGTLSSEEAAGLRDSDGRSLQELRVDSGHAGLLEEVVLSSSYYAAFVELHIEQGPLLEGEGISIGVVQSIAAPAAFNIIIQGEGGHAGTVLMASRKDAFMAASELALAIEAEARSSGSGDTVATVGRCDLFPGAVNSVPSEVSMTLDLRDTCGDRRDRVLAAILDACRRVAARRRVTIAPQPINVDAPATCDRAIIAAIESACDEHSVTHRQMVSRAYHDSLFLSRIAPVGMIFIPSRNGVSHRPDEYSSIEQIAAGVLVLAETLARLAAGVSP